MGNVKSDTGVFWHTDRGDYEEPDENAEGFYHCGSHLVSSYVSVRIFEYL